MTPFLILQLRPEDEAADGGGTGPQCDPHANLAGALLK